MIPELQIKEGEESEEDKEKTKGFFAKVFYPVRHVLNHRNNPWLHTVEWLFVLAAFFAVGFCVIYYQEIPVYFSEPQKFAPDSLEAMIQTPEEQKLFTGEVLPEPIDITEWDTYQNKWYGFEIDHPDAWKNNIQYRQANEKSARYETMYKFRKSDPGEEDIFIGYDVVIYLKRKVENIESTNDVHKKEDAPEDLRGCDISESEIIGEEKQVFWKVSIADDNPCYEPAYFYSLEKGDYIYNIVPAINEKKEKFDNPGEMTALHFPEYKTAVETFEFIPIVRPKPKPKPVITAKRPVSAKLVNGKLVCAKKNDKPKKSDKNPPGHMDMECCLDPDEVPNPWCTY